MLAMHAHFYLWPATFNAISRPPLPFNDESLSCKFVGYHEQGLCVYGLVWSICGIYAAGHWGMQMVQSCTFPDRLY